MKAFASEKHFLGIDIGSVSLGIALIDEHKQILHQDYLFHHGNITQLLQTKLGQIDLSRVALIGHNHRASDFFSDGISVNDQLASIEGMLFQNDQIGSAFVIGGETFGLILFDEANHYQKYISNSSCAAGTGAFLDQQAERLGLSGSSELSRLAEAFQGEAPKIATRCAVFAKTDLIHGQQQGYSIEAISAGLCQGLAHNIYDTLIKGVALREPVAAAGGVSQNPKVMAYLSGLIGFPLVIPAHAAITGAIGCAVIAQSRDEEQHQGATYTIERLVKKSTQEKSYFYGPLSEKRSGYPDFTTHRHYLSGEVEVDVYDPIAGEVNVPAYLGIDIGSTSTKVVVMDANNTTTIRYGLYTRTAGQPIQALQNLLRVLGEIQAQAGVQFDFQGVGTTGSGRHFIQKVINADLAIDEITAHARAAYALNPEVDTIIELGGQDSKFTVLRNGRVTFSVMNFVCAAGTGSFIEEQAKRLGVPLDQYARRASGAPSPLTSDRCTVFMERDLNHYLSQGYAREELLAAALHSVADNYLSKVAHLNKIGKVVCFQGATAKNGALVAVFEKKLQKPIFVSKYCHLTGALGVCLALSEKRVTGTHFRGIDFYKQAPKVTEEVCELCRNACKLKRVQVLDESILWGFMCGRDEADRKRKSTNQSGFDLLSNRRRIFNPANHLEDELEGSPGDMPKHRLALLNGHGIDLSLDKLRENLDVGLLTLRHRLFALRQSDFQEAPGRLAITIGIPNTLYNLELVPFWRYFFMKLGYRVKVSSARDDFVDKGREITGAEFCTPISYWHGHIRDLSQGCDYLFLPQMIQEGDNRNPKVYCYYSNYAVALAQNIRQLGIEQRCITPLINFSGPAIQNLQRIYECLPQELKLLQTPGEMREAYTQAQGWFNARRDLLAQVYRQQMTGLEDISVVLLGRPYLIFDPVLNKNIPELFNTLGVKTFSQDMLPQTSAGEEGPAREFVLWNHWTYGAQILQSAETVGKTPGLYPVYLSAFKCSPDSFVINYFKEVMDAYQKPYLILQIDEHGSDIGYGTRVESAVETFRNHRRRAIDEEDNLSKTGRTMVDPVIVKASPTGFKNKTILIPHNDPICSDLISAAFEHAGYDTVVIEETPITVQASLRLNDGQCLPVSTIVQGTIETIQSRHLAPENTAIFMNAISRLPCNFPQYPLLARKLLKQHGDGFEKAQVFATDSNMSSLPFELIYEVYSSFLLGGLLRKIGCKLRPYERDKGQTDRLIADALRRLHRCIAGGGKKDDVFADIVTDFTRIPLQEGYEPRPKVALLGDMYVQDNDIFNQQVIADLESYGAEVVTAPVTFAVRLMAAKDTYDLNKDGHFLSLLQKKILVEAAELYDRHYHQSANRILNEAPLAYDQPLPDLLARYNLSLKHEGETAQNVLKVFSLLKSYPDLRLFVHVNPIFCCPGLVSEAIFKTVEKDTGVPIVSITYDGTTTEKNAMLAPYMHYILQDFALEEHPLSW